MGVEKLGAWAMLCGSGVVRRGFPETIRELLSKLENDPRRLRVHYPVFPRKDLWEKLKHADSELEMERVARDIARWMRPHAHTILPFGGNLAVAFLDTRLAFISPTFWHDHSETQLLEVCCWFLRFAE